MKHILAAAVVVMFAIVGLTSPANAADYPIPVTVELLKFGSWSSVGKLYKLVSKAYAGGPSFQRPTSSPATTGATLAIVMNDGDLFCDLPVGTGDGAHGWKELGNPRGSRVTSTSKRARPIAIHARSSS